MELLVVSYFANINGLACAHHIDDRLAIFKEKGVSVTVLSTLYVDKTDKARHLRVPSLSGAGARFEVRQFLRKGARPRWLTKLYENLILLPVLPLYLLEKAFLRMDTTWLWFPLAFLRGYFHCLRHSPGAIYSTGGPISAHIAAALISRLTGIRWIAEFQDPLIHSYCARSSMELRLTHWAERFICRHAAHVVFLTDQARVVAQSRTELAQRGACIYPGAPLPAARAEHLRRDCLRLVHFGSLGGSRNLVALLKALGELFRELPGLKSLVRLTLYGRFGDDIRKQLEEFPFPEAVEVQGMVAREASVAAMQQADVLLLIQNVDDVATETIPSKAYEYFHTRRPVLGLIYRNAELRDMLGQLGHLPVEADGVAEIKAGIRTLVERWEAGTLGEGKASPYTVDAAVAQLLMLAGVEAQVQRPLVQST